MAIFRAKKPKQDITRHNDPVIRKTVQAPLTTSHSLYPYRAHAHAQRSDRFTRSYEWNDLRRSPVRSQGPPPQLSSPTQREVPEITSSPVVASLQGSGTKARGNSVFRGHIQGQTVVPMVSLAQQQDRGRTEKRSEVKSERRESVLQRPRADLYHADLLEGAPQKGQNSHSTIKMKFRDSHLPSGPHKTTPAPFLTGATPASVPTAHGSPQTHRPRDLTSSGFVKTPQDVSTSDPADLRAEKAPGTKLRRNPQIGRRRSVMENIMENPYHAMLLEDGSVDDESAESSSGEVEWSPKRTSTITDSPVPTVAYSPPHSTHIDTKTIPNSACSGRSSTADGAHIRTDYELPRLAQHPHHLPHDTSPPLPDYPAPNILAHQIPKRLEPTIPLIPYNGTQHPLPTLPSPSTQNDSLPPFPDSNPSTPTIPRESDTDPEPQPPSSSTPASLPHTSAPVFPNLQIKEPTREARVPVIIGRQTPGSVYLSRRILCIPVSLHTRIVELGIAFADLDAEALTWYVGYLETGLVPGGLVPRGTMGGALGTTTMVDIGVLVGQWEGQWQWESIYPLVNALILSHILRDTVFSTLLLRHLEAYLQRPGIGCPDVKTINHIFSHMDIPDELRALVVKKCVECGMAGLRLNELEVGVLAAVVGRLLAGGLRTREVDERV